MPKNEAWTALLQLVGLTADQALSEQSTFMPYLGQVGDAVSAWHSFMPQPCTAASILPCMLLSER